VKPFKTNTCHIFPFQTPFQSKYLQLLWCSMTRDLQLKAETPEKKDLLLSSSWSFINCIPRRYVLVQDKFVSSQSFFFFFLLIKWTFIFKWVYFNHLNYIWNIVLRINFSSLKWSIAFHGRASLKRIDLQIE
jgi:hypothetical protein